MKEKLFPLVCLPAAALLIRGLYLLATAGRPAKKNFPGLLQAGLGPLLIADLVIAPLHRKTPAP